MRSLVAQRSVVLMACLAAAAAASVKKGMFGVPIFGADADKEARKQAGKLTEHTDEDMEKLAKWLTEQGFAQYATPEFLAKMDEELAYDSIEDMIYLMDDNEYKEIGMSHNDAVKIHDAARRHVMSRFLSEVPPDEGKAAGHYVEYLDVLLKAGFQEPDDLDELEDNDAETELGLTPEQVTKLVERAEQHEAREVLHAVMVTFVDEDQSKPFRDETVWRPLVEKFVTQVGIETLADLANLQTGAEAAAAGIPDDVLTKLQSDPRVQSQKGKQEL